MTYLTSTCSIVTNSIFKQPLEPTVKLKGGYINNYAKDPVVKYDEGVSESHSQINFNDHKQS